MDSASHRQPSSPSDSTQERPRVFKHDSHHDVLRWHLRLHTSVGKECCRNGLPKFTSHYFDPTHAMLTIHGTEERQEWSSRAHRKHRYLSVPMRGTYSRFNKSPWVRLLHMGRIEYWNISWWVAQAFTWGSVVWVVNGFASFLPFVNTHVATSLTATGWTAFLGATIFEIGSVFGILEAWNRDDTLDFGWAVKHSVHHDRDEENPRPHSLSAEKHTHGVTKGDDTKPNRKWIWFSLDPQYFRELGFQAAFWQLVGATIFWISGFTAIPEIQSAIMERIPLRNGVFWTPQVVGGSGFIISSIFIMLESQKKWYKPEPFNIGWQVGIWNFIGAVGFTLCGALGYASSNHGLEYQSSLCTFWGGWGFLIGSLLQWYESVNSK